MPTLCHCFNPLCCCAFLSSIPGTTWLPYAQSQSPPSSLQECGEESHLSPLWWNQPIEKNVVVVRKSGAFPISLNVITVNKHLGCWPVNRVRWIRLDHRAMAPGPLIQCVCELWYYVPPLVINYTRDLITPLTRHWRLSFLVLAVGVGNRWRAQLFMFV